MRLLFYIFILTVFLGCDITSQKEQDKVVFYYVGSNQNGSYKPDTLAFNKISHHVPQDSLIAEQEFEFNSNRHLIQMYTSDLHAPVDGGHLFYELDSFGIIYSRSTTWFAYQRLKSSNDSINSIIDAAIENILLYPKLSCYQYELIFQKEVKFVPPTIE